MSSIGVPISQQTDTGSASPAMSFVDPINLSWLRMDSAMATIEALPSSGSETLSDAENLGSVALAAPAPLMAHRRSVDEALDQPDLRRQHVS
jgi:hypothetical protein